VVPSETGMERRHVLVSMMREGVDSGGKPECQCSWNGSKRQVGVECKKLVLH
jgi:hypothetical protein